MRILIMVALLLCSCLPVWANQPTTVLTRMLQKGDVSVAVPVVDGANDEAMQKQANALLENMAVQVGKELGVPGQVTYEVKLNRPSLVGILFKAVSSTGTKSYYKAANVDLTTGKEFGLNDFLQDGMARRELLKAGYKDVLFAEEGIYTTGQVGTDYTDFVAYTRLMPLLRIGEAGRLLTVWKLTRACEDTTLTVKAGSLLALKLDANPSTGFQWTSTVSGSKNGIVKVGNSFTIPNNTNPKAVGVPGNEIIFYTAQTPGVYKVTMSYKRVWEQNSGVNNFSFTVNVL